MRKCIVFIILLLFVIFKIASAESSYKFAAGVNYPGINLKYMFSEKFGGEFKFQYSEDIKITGLRGYYGLKQFGNLSFFGGLETDVIFFEGELTEGYGFALELFSGFEFLIYKHAVFQLDIGPALILVADKDTKISNSEIQFVLNPAVNFVW